MSDVFSKHILEQLRTAEESQELIFRFFKEHPTNPKNQRKSVSLESPGSKFFSFMNTPIQLIRKQWSGFIKVFRGKTKEHTQHNEEQTRNSRVLFLILTYLAPFFECTYLCSLLLFYFLLWDGLGVVFCGSLRRFWEGF